MRTVFGNCDAKMINMTLDLQLCRDVTTGTYVGKIKVEFCISCSSTKILYLAKFLTEFQSFKTIQSFKTCILKNLNSLSKLISKSYIQQ